MRSFFQIEIPKREACCALCKAHFVEKTPYYSYLIEEKEGHFLRKDHCKSCRDQIKDSYAGCPQWMGKVPAKVESQVPSSTEKHARALEYLKELLSKGDGQDIEEAFVLALYLARKKKIVVRDEMDQGDERYFLYEIVETEEVLPIKAVSLSLMETSRIQENIATRLKS